MGILGDLSAAELGALIVLAIILLAVSGYIAYWLYARDEPDTGANQDAGLQGSPTTSTPPSSPPGFPILVGKAVGRNTDMVAITSTTSPVAITGLETDKYRMVVGAGYLYIIDKTDKDYVAYAAGSAAGGTDQLLLEPDGKLWFGFPGSAGIFHLVLNRNTGTGPVALILSEGKNLLEIRGRLGATLWAVPAAGPLPRRRTTFPFTGVAPFPTLQNAKYITVVRGGYHLDILEKYSMRLLRTLSPPLNALLNSYGVGNPRIELTESGNVVWYVHENQVARTEGLGLSKNNGPFNLELLDNGMLRISAIVTGRSHEF